MSPFLKRLGYGFDMPKGVVMWWGALRGAVALALALLVAQDDVLDPHTVGNKVTRVSMHYCATRFKQHREELKDRLPPSRRSEREFYSYEITSIFSRSKTRRQTPYLVNCRMVD